MSQENVELVEQSLDAYRRRGIEALRALQAIVECLRGAFDRPADRPWPG